MLWFMDGVDEAATNPSDVFILLICPCCYCTIFNAMVEQRGFVQDLSGRRNLWLWQRSHEIEDGELEALKVVCRWQVWRDLLTMSKGDRRSGARKAQGRSLVDMPQ
jgi:hypothetical protein